MRKCHVYLIWLNYATKSISKQKVNFQAKQIYNEACLSVYGVNLKCLSTNNICLRGQMAYHTLISKRFFVATVNIIKKP